MKSQTAQAIVKAGLSQYAEQDYKDIPYHEIIRGSQLSETSMRRFFPRGKEDHHAFVLHNASRIFLREYETVLGNALATDAIKTYLATVVSGLTGKNGDGIRDVVRVLFRAETRLVANLPHIKLLEELLEDLPAVERKPFFIILQGSFKELVERNEQGDTCITSVVQMLLFFFKKKDIPLQEAEEKGVSSATLRRIDKELGEMRNVLSHILKELPA